MKISELQEYLKDRLNDVQALVQHGCKAFAEDTREVYEESNQWTSAGNVAIVVVTPDLRRNGSCADGISVDGQILVRCIEKPALASSNTNAIRALDAAEIVAHELDDRSIEFQDIKQTVDRTAGTVVATATFSTTIKLTKED